jgi:hypothetical protein
VILIGRILAGIAFRPRHRHRRCYLGIVLSQRGVRVA